VRLMGGLLTVAAFFLWGTSLAAKQKDSLAVLDAVLALLRELSARLLHRREGLRSIFAAYEDPRLAPYGFLELLKSHDGRDYPSLWTSALALLPLPKEALPPLRTLGSSLGRVSLEAQGEQLALAIALLETVQRELLAGAFQKRKSTVALWTLGGLLAALLLL